MAWRSDRGTLPEWDRMKIDNGEEAYRVLHTEARKVLPIPFQRKIDCDRAASIMNTEFPCDGITDEEDVRQVIAAVTSFKKLRKRLIAECCAW